MSLRHFFPLFFVLGAVFFTGMALADTAQRVQQLKAQGNEAMSSGRPEDALRAYDEAYSLEARDDLVYNRGRALQALARYPEALDALVQFKREAPSELKGRVAGLDELIAEVRSRIHTLNLQVNVKTAEIELRGENLPEALRGPVRINAGPGRLRVHAAGFAPYERDLEFVGGKSSVVKVDLVPLGIIGIVAIASPRAGAVVTVDGRRMGTVPIELRLSKGSHHVELEKNGYKPATTTVEVTVGSRKELHIDLAKRKKVTQRWWFWTAVGVGLAGGAAGAIAGTTERKADTGTIPPGQVSY